MATERDADAGGEAQDWVSLVRAAQARVPDKLSGEVVTAFVVAADPADPPSGEELTVFARGVLADFKVPARWEVVPSLPRSATGKLLRRALVR